MEKAVGIFIVFLGTFGHVNCAGDWGYHIDNGPDHWAENNPKCAGSKQSPIDIPEQEELYENMQLGKFSFHGYDDTSIKMTLANNGHTAVVNLGDGVWIEGGGLSSKYIAAQFHFHWGADNLQGSEHTLEGRKFPLEMHIVHYKEEYGTLGNALPKPDGLAVIGIFATDTEHENKDIKGLVDNLHHVAVPSDPDYELTGLSLNKLLPTYMDHFYRYNGSLTTPTCDESVTWTVLTERIKISYDQLEKFRELFENDPKYNIVNNYRPVQPLNNRRIYTNFEIKSGSSSINNFISWSITITAMLIFSRL